MHIFLNGKADESKRKLHVLQSQHFRWNFRPTSVKISSNYHNCDLYIGE